MSNLYCFRETDQKVAPSSVSSPSLTGREEEEGHEEEEVFAENRLN